MRIKTITCHDVYNVGASLQAYALQEYLKSLGHNVEIIDYKPEYLSRHYSLTAVNNPKYRKPFLREIYILLKLRGRIKALKNEKKLAFDRFKNDYLQLTNKKYKSNIELKKNCPEADIYLAGSDQIWNPLFQNGKDPAFFLDFVPEGKIKASYAASFAVESIDEIERLRMADLLHSLDYISVRESSALRILESMNLSGIHVCDPVFLLSAEVWRTIRKPFDHKNKYIFVYDFDSNKSIQNMIRKYAAENKLDIISAFPFEGGKQVRNLGPLEFLGVIENAEMVISNSFHATAFSLIFHTSFLVFNRKEKINARMKDLISFYGVDEQAILTENEEVHAITYDWNFIDLKKEEIVNNSKAFISTVIGKANTK